MTTPITSTPTQTPITATLAELRRARYRYAEYALRGPTADIRAAARLLFERLDAEVRRAEATPDPDGRLREVLAAPPIP